MWNSNYFKLNLISHMVQNWKTMPKTIKTLGFISICISVLIALNQASEGFERKSVGESLIQDAKKLLPYPRH